MVFVEGDEYRQLRRPGGDPAQFRSIVRPVQTPPVPDSLIHEYRAQNFTSTTWPDSEQSSDISVIQLSPSTVNGEPSVRGDGVDDFGSDGTIDPFGSNTGSDFAFELILQTSDTGACFGVTDNDMALSARTDSAFNATANKFSFILSSNGGAGGNIVVSSQTTVTDGTARHIIVNKTGNSASDVNIILNNSVDPTTTISNSFVPSNARDFTRPLSYFASNFEGNRNAALLQAEIPFIRIFDDSLSASEQQTLFQRQVYV
jgi:hypothetical protein